VTTARGDLCVESSDETLVFTLTVGLNCTETPVAVDVVVVSLFLTVAGVHILPGDLGVLRELLGIDADEAATDRTYAGVGAR